MSDSQIDNQSTSSETKVAKTATHDLVPAKSAYIYEAAYTRFIRWRETKNLNSFSETVFLAYFLYLKTEMKMKSSSLWSHYSMIRSIMNMKHGKDISRFFKLRIFLKKENEFYIPKKSRSFTKKQIDTFLSDASDQQYLGLKIVLVIGISGGCRCDEMVKMRTGDFEDLGTFIQVKIPYSNTKKYRSFTIVGDMFIDIYRKYISLRPENILDSRFFVKYINGKCHRLVMGLHKIGGVPKEVASILKLPDCGDYTGHSLRRTAATLLGNGEAVFAAWKRRDRQHSTDVGTSCTAVDRLSFGVPATRLKDNVNMDTEDVDDAFPMKDDVKAEPIEFVEEELPIDEKINPSELRKYMEEQKNPLENIEPNEHFLSENSDMNPVDIKKEPILSDRNETRYFQDFATQTTFTWEDIKALQDENKSLKSQIETMKQHIVKLL